jgi:metal transporter CNNM
VKDVKINIDGEKQPSLDKTLKSKRVLQKWKSFPNGANNSYKGGSRSKKWSKDMYSDILQIDGNPLPKLPEEEEAVGIITMEDVIEELLQVQVIIFCLINFQRYCYFLIDGPLTSIWRCVGGDL